MNKRQRLLEGNKKAQKVFDVYYGDIIDRLSKEDCQQKFGMLRKTRKFCSNPVCCGNPRRKKGQKEVPLKELVYEDDLEEFDAIKIKL